MTPELRAVAAMVNGRSDGERLLLVVAAIRAAESDVLEQAAKIAEHDSFAAQMIRALKREPVSS